MPKGRFHKKPEGKVIPKQKVSKMSPMSKDGIEVYGIDGGEIIYSLVGSSMKLRIPKAFKENSKRLKAILAKQPKLSKAEMIAQIERNSK